MKKMIVLLSVFGVVAVMAGCSNSNQKRERSAKKIYLTKEDYMEDLKPGAEWDRRELQPNKESKYIFNVVPKTDKDAATYFFDKRQNPKVPGEYTAQEYKNEKRLWKKPKRYSPEQYYGMQDGADTANPATDSEESYYE